METVETLVAQVQGALLEHQHQNPDRRHVCEQFASFIAEYGAAAWSRQTSVGHLTASAWIVSPDFREALLLFHPKLCRWLQPGGHVEEGEELHVAAAREAQEESGLEVLLHSPQIFDVDIHEVPARGNIAAHLHYDVRFLFKADRLAPQPGPGESQQIEWFLLNQIATLGVDESVLRLGRLTQHLEGK